MSRDEETSELLHMFLGEDGRSVPCNASCSYSERRHLGAAVVVVAGCVSRMDVKIPWEIQKREEEQRWEKKSQEAGSEHDFEELKMSLD